LTVEVDVVPTFELPPYKGLPARIEHRPVTDVDVDGFIRGKTEELSAFHAKHEPLALGDAARVKVQRVTTSGLPLVGEGAAEFTLMLKDDETPSELIQALVGRRTGEEAMVTLPPGKRGLVQAPRASEEGESYSITVLNALSVEPPDPARLASEFGVDDPSELPIRVRVLLEDIRDREARSTMRDELIARVTRSAVIHLPPSLVDARVEEIRQSLIEKAEADGREPNAEILDPKFFTERHNEQIRHGLKEILVVEAIADQVGLIATRQQIDAAVDAQAQATGVTRKQRLKQLGEDGLEALARRITRASVAHYLEDEAEAELTETR
jgi:FKBP-type peptidyl-prolyl cis-trans isomerase (trigger factor)